jgi:exonuclease III
MAASIDRLFSSPPSLDDLQEAPFSLPNHFNSLLGRRSFAASSMPFDIITWNAGGLHTSAKATQAAKLRHLVRLLRKAPCICVQETHANHEDVADLDRWAARNGAKIFYGFDHAAEAQRCDRDKEAPPQSGGVMFVIRRDLVEKHSIKEIIIRPYWIHALVGGGSRDSPEGHFVIVNLYLSS